MTVQVPMKTYVCKMMKKILDNTTTSGAVHEIVDSKDSKKISKNIRKTISTGNNQVITEPDLDLLNRLKILLKY